MLFFNECLNVDLIRYMKDVSLTIQFLTNRQFFLRLFHFFFGFFTRTIIFFIKNRLPAKVTLCFNWFCIINNYRNLPIFFLNGENNFIEYFWIVNRSIGVFFFNKSVAINRSINQNLKKKPNKRTKN